MRKTVLFILTVLLSSVYALACDCGRGIISPRDFNSHDWIFVGTLFREQRIDKPWYRKCYYKVVIAYKGVKQGDTIQVCDQEDVGACGLGRMTRGADYLIYALGNEEKWTSRCVGNSRVPIYVLPRDSFAINNMKAGEYHGWMDDSLYSTFHTDSAFLNAHVPKVQKNTTQQFYDRKGKISAEGRYKNGIPDGLWRYYDRGELTEYGRYVNGKKDSMWVRQYGTSKDIEEYKAGEYTYRQRDYERGRLYSKKEPVGDGKKWINAVYHDNGKPRFIAYAHPPKRNDKGRLKDPVWHGPFKSFNKAGVVLDEGVHEDGYSTGHWKYYYEDGKLRMEGDYIMGKKTGVWKIYHRNKRIKATGSYDEGEKTGVWKYYDVNGKEIPPNPELIKEDEDWFTYTGAKEY